MSGHVVKLGTVEVVMTGIEFMIYANRYCAAAEAVGYRTTDEWFDPIPYHLFCQSLDMHLKSFIWLSDRLSRDKYRNKYGHNIIKLWNHAKERGIDKYCAATQLRDQTIEFVGPYYKERKFVYLDLSMSSVGIPELRANRHVLSTIRRLCKQLQKSLKMPILNSS